MLCVALSQSNRLISLAIFSFAPRANRPNTTPAGTPSPTPTCLCQYETTTGTGTIVAATTDTGNHCDDCTTTISAPFPVFLYGTSFTSIVVSSNGNLQFGSNSSENRPFCPLPNCLLDDVILAYQGDLRTGSGSRLREFCRWLWGFHLGYGHCAQSAIQY